MQKKNPTNLSLSIKNEEGAAKNCIYRWRQANYLLKSEIGIKAKRVEIEKVQITSPGLLFGVNIFS